MPDQASACCTTDLLVMTFVFACLHKQMNLSILFLVACQAAHAAPPACHTFALHCQARQCFAVMQLVSMLHSG